MKKMVKIMMLAAVLMLTACNPSAEDMLIGRWKLYRAIETVVEASTGAATTDTLPGYDTQVMEFMSDATCFVADRGDTTFYMWSLTGGRTLALWRDGWAEDYYINALSNSLLVYSDTYSYYDSVSRRHYDYTYTFKYKKF